MTTNTPPQYGFLTRFDDISPDEARQRIKMMVEMYDIRDFQFYDAFYTYSQPLKLGSPRFQTKVSYHLIDTHPPHYVNLDIIKVYIDEIKKHNGRAWLYVQSVGADEPSLSGFTRSHHQHDVNGQPLLYCYIPDQKWAQRMCDIWVPYALYLGFSGIHWDSLGYCNGAFGNGEIFTIFLNSTARLLKEHGLLQTFNFVDGFGYNPQLVLDGIITFPYWEVWTLPDVEDAFFNAMSQLPEDKKGVFVCYGTGKHNPPSYSFNELICLRWDKCIKQGCKYLLIGDGCRTVKNEYFVSS